MLSNDKFMEIFVSVDDFCIHFDHFLPKSLTGQFSNQIMASLSKLASLGDKQD